MSKGEEALKDIKNVAPDAKVEVLEPNLASFKSIEKVSREFTFKYDRLDVLANNAGLVCQAFRRTVAKQLGYRNLPICRWPFRRQNQLLLPTLVKTVDQPNANVRIINLTSGGYTFALAPGISFADTSLPDKSIWARYGQSKLANILFTRELAKR